MFGTFMAINMISGLLGQLTNSLTGLIGQMVGGNNSAHQFQGGYGRDYQSGSFSERLKNLEDRFNQEFNAYQNGGRCGGGRTPSTGGCGGSGRYDCDQKPSGRPDRPGGCGGYDPFGNGNDNRPPWWSAFDPSWTGCGNQGVMQICCTLYPR